MKILQKAKLAITLITTLATFQFAHAAGGIGDGGGGTSLPNKSSIADVQKAFDQLKSDKSDIGRDKDGLYSLLAEMANAYPIVRNIEVRDTLDLLFGNIWPHRHGKIPEPLFKAKYFPLESIVLNSPVFKDITESGFFLKEKGLCKTPEGKFEMAAVTSYKKGTPICFSLEALRKLSKHELSYQLRALAMHEITHHFVGSNEALADKIQKFVFYKVLDESGNRDTRLLQTLDAYVIWPIFGPMRTNNSKKFDSDDYDDYAETTYKLNRELYVYNFDPNKIAIPLTLSEASRYWTPGRICSLVAGSYLDVSKEHIPAEFSSRLMRVNEAGGADIVGLFIKEIWPKLNAPNQFFEGCLLSYFNPREVVISEAEWNQRWLNSLDILSEFRMKAIELLRANADEEYLNN